MQILVLRTEPKCKICKSPHRSEIDELLMLRSQHGKLKDGTKVNAQYVFTKMTEFGIPNPNLENLRLHWGDKRHSKMVADNDPSLDIDARTAAEVDEIFDEIYGKDWKSRGDIRPEQDAQMVRALYRRKVYKRAQAGEEIAIDTPSAMRAAEVGLKSKMNDATAELLGNLGRAIGQSAAKALEPAPDDRLEIIDGETVEEEVPVDEVTA